MCARVCACAYIAVFVGNYFFTNTVARNARDIALLLEMRKRGVPCVENQVERNRNIANTRGTNYGAARLRGCVLRTCNFVSTFSFRVGININNPLGQ